MQYRFINTPCVRLMSVILCAALVLCAVPQSVPCAVVRPSALTSCLAPVPKAKTAVVIPFDAKKDLFAFSNLLPRADKIPFDMFLRFVQTAFGGGLAVLNSCAGQALKKTFSAVSSSHPAYINAVLAWNMFRAEDESFRFTGEVSAFAICRWLSLMTGGYTTEKVKTYELTPAQFASLPDDIAKAIADEDDDAVGLYLYGDGRHWSSSKADLQGDKIYVIADGTTAGRKLGLQWPMRADDTVWVYGAGLRREINNQKSLNGIRIFWTVVVGAAIFSVLVFGPDIAAFFAVRLQADNPQLFDALQQLGFFKAADGVQGQFVFGLGLAGLVVGARKSFSEFMVPFSSRNSFSGGSRRSYGPGGNSPNSNKPDRGIKGLLRRLKRARLRREYARRNEKVIKSAAASGVRLLPAGVDWEAWTNYGQKTVTRNGAEVPDQWSLAAYEPVFNEDREFLYWKPSVVEANIFYRGENARPEEEGAWLEVAAASGHADTGDITNIAVIALAAENGVVLPFSGINRDAWTESGKRWITRNGAEVPGEAMLAAYSPVFEPASGEFMYWQFIGMVQNPFSVGPLVFGERSAFGRKMQGGGFAQFFTASHVVEKKAGTVPNAWELRQDYFQNTLLAVAA